MGVSVWVIYLILLSSYATEHYIYTSGLNPFNSQLGFGKQILVDVYRYAIGFIGSIAMLWILFALYNHLKHSRLGLIVEIVGRNSLKIYLFQRLLLERCIAGLWRKLCNYMGYNLFESAPGVFNLIISPMIAIGVTFTIFVCIKLLDKIPCANKVLFGK